ncbi:hypothetical protein [Anatilimnocola floriformis]|uniref:hypothetical protein n=1 Tax=Anatilimnocola floriformis TaxID=2948575 RepID=UPI0020C50B10|nr:hypothetical protein [Anatilimnocola floriformis]
MNLSMKLLVAGCLSVACAVAVPTLQAQKVDGKAEAKTEAKAGEKKASRRLPNFYGDLVDGTQKQKIYDIQDKYTPQIDALAEQIKTLQQKRDSEIEGVLTPEQKVKFDKAKAESKTKAAERAAAKKATDKAVVEVKATTPAITPTTAPAAIAPAAVTKPIK